MESKRDPGSACHLLRQDLPVPVFDQPGDPADVTDKPEPRRCRLESQRVLRSPSRLRRRDSPIRWDNIPATEYCGNLQFVVDGSVHIVQPNRQHGTARRRLRTRVDIRRFQLDSPAHTYQQYSLLRELVSRHGLHRRRIRSHAHILEWHIKERTDWDILRVPRNSLETQLDPNYYS